MTPLLSRTPADIWCFRHINLQAELKRRLKVAPTAFYAEPPASLFAANAAAGFLPGWDFTAV